LSIELLTVEWINDRVATIAKVSGDPEAAHSMEDGLYLTTLQAIASGAPNAAELAAAALKADALDFPRWCA
jgi:hypothetical protein